MVKLIAYAIELSAGTRVCGSDSRTKFRQLAKSLAEYIGPGRDDVILVQAGEGWLEGYFAFLCQSYSSNKDASADPADLPELRRRRALDHLRTLRRLNFNAAEEGIIPDIDFLAAVPEAGLSRSKNIVTPDFQAQVQRLIAIRSADTTFAGAIDRYLMALALCGLPLHLLHGVLDSITPGSSSVFLPHLGADIPLSPWIRDKAIAIKSRKNPADTTASEAAATANYDTLFRHLGVTLFRSGSPFTDWLSLTRRIAGATDAVLLPVIRAYLTPEASKAHADRVGELAAAVQTLLSEAERKATARHYYAVKVYGTSAESELATLPEEAPEVWSAIQGHVWCPCTTSRPTTNIERIVARRGKVVDERRTVMRDLFFARATTADIARLDRIPNLWVFQTREGTARRYTRISPAELRAMRAILDRIGPSPDIEFSITDAPPPSADFLPDDTVRLLLPGFEDIEARITKKITSSSHPTYLITFLTADGKHIRMTVPPSALAALTG